MPKWGYIAEKHEGEEKVTTLKGLSLMNGVGFYLSQGSGYSGNEDQVISLLP